MLKQFGSILFLCLTIGILSTVFFVCLLEKTGATSEISNLEATPLIAQNHLSVLKPRPTKTPTPSPTPLTSLLGAWTEFSPGSASRSGISYGKGNPKSYVGVVADTDGHPVVAWPRIMPNGETYVFVKKWNGTEWIDLGCDLENDIPIYEGPLGVNRLVIDPQDGSLILSMDFYKNFLMKFNGESWNDWANGGINDEGLEFFTDIGFLADGTPVATYVSGVGSEYADIRVKKFLYGDWQEFSSGSGSGYGIYGSYARGIGVPQMAITNKGKIYAAWLHNPRWENQYLYVKQWDGSQWVEAGTDSASDQGVSLGETLITPRTMILDEYDRPVVTYLHQRDMADGTHRNVIYVKRFNGKSWEEMGTGSASGEGLCDEGQAGAYSLLVKTSENRLVVIWSNQDNNAFYAKQWNGNAWIPAGEGSASGTGIAVGYNPDAVALPDGTIVLAYADIDTRNIFVRQFRPNEVAVPTPTPTIPSATSGGWLMVDGFGGIHASNAKMNKPSLPYFPDFNIVRDIEPDPWGRGWYMLDGFGGIHRSSTELPMPGGLPYFGFDIARNLEIQKTSSGLAFYLLDGLGTVYDSYGNVYSLDETWFGTDRAVDLEPDPKEAGWWILDRQGILYSLEKEDIRYPLHTVWSQQPLLRSIVLFSDWTSVLIDAYGGRHSDPYNPAVDIMDGMPKELYFPGWEIIWDIEYVPAK